MRDPVLWNDWHAIAEVATLRPNTPFATTLLDVPLTVTSAGGAPAATRDDGGPLAAAERYGYLWVCLGEPAQGIVDIPEAGDDWRFVTSAGSFGVAAAAPRVVENFLDVGHFPYVHENYLGAEPHTEIRPYEVSRLPEGGIVAVDCRIQQPIALHEGQQGFEVSYVYKVLRPLIACLSKTNPIDPTRVDLVFIFVQPVGEEASIAHNLALFGKDGTTESDLRWFQQLIFLQDKPILENQIPRRLPIGPGMEMAIPADKSSVFYRRWLAEIGLRYGTVGLEAAPA